MNSDDDLESRRAIISAAESADMDRLQILLDVKPSLVNAWADGYTPLMKAAEKGHVDVLALLLQSLPVSAVNRRDNTGWTALHYASASGRTAIVSLLLEAGAKGSVRDSTGQTSLMYAARAGHVDIVETLLEEGDQDVDDVDYRNTTALWKACNGGHQQAALILLLQVSRPQTLEKPFLYSTLAMRCWPIERRL